MTHPTPPCDPYAEWAAGTREEARAAYLHTARALADLCRCSGRVDDAVRYLLHLLDHDRYEHAAGTGTGGVSTPPRVIAAARHATGSVTGSPPPAGRP